MTLPRSLNPAREIHYVTDKDHDSRQIEVFFKFGADAKHLRVELQRATEITNITKNCDIKVLNLDDATDNITYRGEVRVKEAFWLDNVQNGDYIYVWRDIPNDQTANFDSDVLLSTTLMKATDKLTMLHQDYKPSYAGVFRLSEAERDDFETMLPLADKRADTLLGFKEDGTLFLFDQKDFLIPDTVLRFADEGNSGLILDKIRGNARSVFWVDNQEKIRLKPYNQFLEIQSDMGQSEVLTMDLYSMNDGDLLLYSGTKHDRKIVGCPWSTVVTVPLQQHAPIMLMNQIMDGQFVKYNAENNTLVGASIEPTAKYIFYNGFEKADTLGMYKDEVQPGDVICLDLQPDSSDYHLKGKPATSFVQTVNASDTAPQLDIANIQDEQLLQLKDGKIVGTSGGPLPIANYIHTEDFQPTETVGLSRLNFIEDQILQITHDGNNKWELHGIDKPPAPTEYVHAENFPDGEYPIMQRISDKRVLVTNYRGSTCYIEGKQQYFFVESNSIAEERVLFDPRSSVDDEYLTTRRNPLDEKSITIVSKPLPPVPAPIVDYIHTVNFDPSQSVFMNSEDITDLGMMRLFQRPDSQYYIGSIDELLFLRTDDSPKAPVFKMQKISQGDALVLEGEEIVGKPMIVPDNYVRAVYFGDDYPQLYPGTEGNFLVWSAGYRITDKSPKDFMKVNRLGNEEVLFDPYSVTPGDYLTVIQHESGNMTIISTPPLPPPAPANVVTTVNFPDTESVVIDGTAITNNNLLTITKNGSTWNIGGSKLDRYVRTTSDVPAFTLNVSSIYEGNILYLNGNKIEGTTLPNFLRINNKPPDASIYLDAAKIGDNQLLKMLPDKSIVGTNPDIEIKDKDNPDAPVTLSLGGPMPGVLVYNNPTGGEYMGGLFSLYQFARSTGTDEKAPFFDTAKMAPNQLLYVSRKGNPPTDFQYVEGMDMPKWNSFVQTSNSSVAAPKIARDQIAEGQFLMLTDGNLIIGGTPVPPNNYKIMKKIITQNEEIADLESEEDIISLKKRGTPGEATYAFTSATKQFFFGLMENDPTEYVLIYISQ